MGVCACLMGYPDRDRAVVGLGHAYYEVGISQSPSPRQSLALLIYICLIGFGAKWSLSAGKFEPIVMISYMEGRKPGCLLSPASSTNVL